MVAVAGLVTALGVTAPAAHAADSGTYESPGCAAFNRDKTFNQVLVFGAAFEPGDTITFGSVSFGSSINAFFGKLTPDGLGIENGYTEIQSAFTIGIQTIQVPTNTDYVDFFVVTNVLALEFSCTSVQQYDVSQFRAPVDAAPVVNRVKAGSTVPMKFAVNNQAGAPVTDLTTADVSLVGASYDCGSAPVDEIENTVSASLAGTLENNGDGTYQYNVKIDRAWQGMCRSIGIKTNYGGQRSALFQVK